MRGERPLLGLLLCAGTLCVAGVVGAEPAPSDTAPLEYRSLWIPTGHALVLMTGMRAVEAVIWPEPFADPRLSRMGPYYQEAFTRPPVWDSSQPWFQQDGDPWAVNAVGHALFGSELYLRARSCALSPLEALAFTTAASTAWEYVWEANGAQPSALDLVYTPLSGLLFGELRWLGYRATRQLRSPVLRAVLGATLDPFGELERGFGTRC